MEHSLFQSFKLLHAIVNTNYNSLEYQTIKRQLNQEELSVLKKWQEKQYAINKRAKRNKKEEQHGMIIPDSINNALMIVSDKPKRKYVRKKQDNERMAQSVVSTSIFVFILLKFSNIKNIYRERQLINGIDSFVQL